MRATVDEMRNKVKINDWLSLTSLFDKLNKQLEKVQRASNTSAIPGFYFRALATLEAAIEATFANKPAIKKMSSTNAKAFNSIRQRLKKHARDDETMAAGIARAKEHPDSTEDEASSDDDSDSDSDSDDEEKAQKAEKKARREAEKAQQAAAGVSGGGDDGFEVVGKKGQVEKKELDVMKCPKEKVTYEMVDKKLAEVIASRGKKGTDRHENVDVLAYLAEVSTCAAQEVETLIMLISAQFDISGSMATHMPIPIWKKCVNNLIRIDQLLKENAQISLTESAEPEPKPAPEEIVAGAPVQLWGSLCAFTERLDDEYFKSMQSIDPHAKEYVYRMQDESLFIVLASEMVAYYEKRDAPDVTCKLALRLLEHLYYKPEPVYEALRAFAEKKLRDADALAAKLAADAEAARQAAEERARLEAERAKQAEEEGDEYLDDEDADEAEAKEASEIPYPTGVTFPVETLPRTLDRLALLIFKDGDGRQKARAMLCQIFTAGLTGDFRRGRDLMLMSHLQENISQMDISTQILFNRAMAQLGLSAFRLGMFHEAQACLGELYLGGRVRELLAQGVTQSRFHERSQEQEKLERRRQMPFHMHINLDLLESVHLVCSMLIEVPHMANSARRARSNNKPFARLVDGYERQTFNGPPETAREHVMAATRAMLAGEWRAAADLILGLECWALLPENSKDRVLGAVTRRLKEEALRTYLFQFAAQYNSVSLDVVAAMFDLDRKAAYGLVSKMIVNEELHGMCDEPSASVVMAHVEPTRLQQLAMTFAEKCAVLLDANERALDLHVGAGGAQLFDYEEELHQDQRRGGGRGGRGGGGRGGGGRGGDWDDEQGGRGGRGGRGRGGGLGRGGDRDGGGRGGRKRFQESYGNFSGRRGGDGDFSKRGGGRFKKEEKSEQNDPTERMVSLGSSAQWRK